MLVLNSIVEHRQDFQNADHCARLMFRNGVKPIRDLPSVVFTRLTHALHQTSSANDTNYTKHTNSTERTSSSTSVCITSICADTKQDEVQHNQCGVNVVERVEEEISKLLVHSSKAEYAH